MITNNNPLVISEVLDYIANTTAEERTETVSEFLNAMNSLAQSAINLFEKDKIALTLHDIAIEFKVVDYAENRNIILLRHGFPANGMPLTQFLIKLAKEKEDGMEQSGTSQDETQTE